MKLLRLRLENFRQHQDSDIPFRDGMTAIVGANGTGKTTILEAITFALYGVQRKTKESVRFLWAEPKAKLHVMLEFEFEGRVYQLDRTGTDAALVDITAEPWITQSTGLREVKASCEKLLRLTYDQFKNSFCAEQKSLAFLQFNTDTRRQEQVAKMLGFDRLKSAADLARERGRIFRGIAEQLAATMGNIDQLRSDHKVAQDEVRAKKSLGEQMERLRVDLSKQVPPAEQKKKLADEFHRLTQEANVVGGKAEALKLYRKRSEEMVVTATANVKRRMDLTPAYGEYLKLADSVREMQALRELELEREKMSSELTRIEAEIKELERKVAELKPGDLAAARKEALACGAAQTAASNALRQAEAAWSRDKQAAQAQLSTANANRKQAEQALTKAKDLAEKGICPECGQPTSGTFEAVLRALESERDLQLKAAGEAERAYKEAEARPKAIFDAEEELDKSRDALARAQEALTAAERAESQAVGLQEERASKVKRADVLRTELARSIPLYDRQAQVQAEARLKELKPLADEFLKLAGAEESLREAEKAFEEAKKQIDEARAGYQELMAERAKLPFATVDEAKLAVTDFEQLRGKAAEAEALFNQAEASLKLAENNLQRTEERIEVYEKAEASLKDSRTEALLHETADKELKRLREELNSVIVPDLEARASENLSLLTNGRYPVLELDDEFNPTVVEDGIKKQVISGGEEDVVALALRMALSELIQERQGRPMSLMILDEVFGSLDADRRQAVLERLQAIKGRFAQILVISHIEEINQVADQCIFLTRDERTRSSVIGDLPLRSEELALQL